MSQFSIYAADEKTAQGNTMFPIFSKDTVVFSWLNSYIVYGLYYKRMHGFVHREFSAFNVQAPSLPCNVMCECNSCSIFN